MIVKFVTKAVLLGVRWGIARYVARHVHHTLWTTEQRVRIYRDIQILRLRRKREESQTERKKQRWIPKPPARKRGPKP